MFKILRHVFLSILSLFFIFPFLWMLISSFKPENEFFLVLLIFFHRIFP